MLHPSTQQNTRTPAVAYITEWCTWQFKVLVPTRIKVICIRIGTRQSFWWRVDVSKFCSRSKHFTGYNESEKSKYYECGRIACTEILPDIYCLVLNTGLFPLLLVYSRTCRSMVLGMPTLHIAHLSQLLTCKSAVQRRYIPHIHS